MRFSRSSLRSPALPIRVAHRHELRTFLANVTLVTVAFLFIAAVTLGLVP
jgi:hypothetical protein